MPGKAQLEKYASRKAFTRAKGVTSKIAVLSECSHDYAVIHLAATNINGIEIKPISWKDIAEVARKARLSATNAEKRIVSELLTYLGGLMTMQSVDSKLVLVVSLGAEHPMGGRFHGLMWLRRGDDTSIE